MDGFRKNLGFGFGFGYRNNTTFYSLSVITWFYPLTVWNCSLTYSLTVLRGFSNKNYSVCWACLYCLQSWVVLLPASHHHHHVYQPPPPYQDISLPSPHLHRPPTVSVGMSADRRRPRSTLATFRHTRTSKLKSTTRSITYFHSAQWCSWPGVWTPYPQQE